MEFSKQSFMLSGYPRAHHRSPAVPLYRRIHGGSLDFVGTGTLIQYRGRYLLVSCAHCFDDNGQHNVIVGAREAFAIDPTVIATQLPPGVDRNHDPVDFAVVELKPNEVENLAAYSAFIPENAIEGPILKDWSEDFGVLGFLASDNFVKAADRTLTSNAVELPAGKAHKFHDRRTQKHPTWYLPLTFEPKKYLNSIQSGIDIQSPEGLSGSPIIRYTHNLFYSFAGIVIEHKACRRKGQVLLGLRSRVIRNLLDRWWQRIVSTGLMP